MSVTYKVLRSISSGLSKGKAIMSSSLNYYSYAHLFYTEKIPPGTNSYYDRDWLLNCPVDKPVFFVCRITDREAWRKHPNLEQLGEKNGFVFLERR